MKPVQEPLTCWCWATKSRRKLNSCSFRGTTPLRGRAFPSRGSCACPRGKAGGGRGQGDPLVLRQDPQLPSAHLLRNVGVDQSLQGHKALEVGRRQRVRFVPVSNAALQGLEPHLRVFEHEGHLLGELKLPCVRASQALRGSCGGKRMPCRAAPSALCCSFLPAMCPRFSLRPPPLRPSPLNGLPPPSLPWPPLSLLRAHPSCIRESWQLRPPSSHSPFHPRCLPRSPLFPRLRPSPIASRPRALHARSTTLSHLNPLPSRSTPPPPRAASSPSLRSSAAACGSRRQR